MKWAMKKICEYCSKEYKTGRDNSKFCCLDCKKKYGRVEVNCANCGKDKVVYRSAIIKNTNHFCDNKCQWEWRHKSGECIGNSHPNKKEYRKVVCVNCNIEFKVRPDRHKRNKSKIFYCCQKCHGEYKTKSIGEKHPRYSQVEVFCKNCGKILKKKKSHSGYSDIHFCCKECYEESIKPRPILCTDYDGIINEPIIVYCEICSAKFIVNKGRYDRSGTKRFYCKIHRFLSARGERNYNWKGITNIHCDFCGIEFEIKQSRINANVNQGSRIYCSKDCASKHHGELFRGENHPRWTGGPDSLPLIIRGKPEYIEVKKKCFERDNYCSFLSGNKSKKKDGLNHHHINSLSYLIDKYSITVDNYNEFYDILFDIDNVITLLDYEHENIHKLYGYKTTREHFEEFKVNFMGGKYENE